MSFKGYGKRKSVDSVSEEFNPSEFTDGLDDAEFIEDESVGDEEHQEGGEDSPEYARAVKAACNILAYADNTERRLRGKLANKGYSHGAIGHAVEYVKGKGWLDEARMSEAAVRYLTETKLYGRRRVLLELRKREFSSEIIDGFDFSDIDFTEICDRLYDKQGGGDDDKTRASLLRYGHTLSDINKAIKNHMEA